MQKLLDGCFTTAFSHSVSLFSHKSIKATVTLITTNKLKLRWCLESLSLKVLRHWTLSHGRKKITSIQGEILRLNQVTPSSAPGVEIRTLSKFGTGSQLFLKMPVCSVNSDIFFTVHVAFMILKMSDFSRLALDGNNIKKIQSKGDT